MFFYISVGNQVSQMTKLLCEGVAGGAEPLCVAAGSRGSAVCIAGRAINTVFLVSDLTNQVETTEHKLQKVTAEMDHYKKLLM